MSGRAIKKGRAPSAGECCALLEYEPASGVLLWRHRPREMFKTDLAFHMWNKRFAGKQAGNVGPQGYRVVSIHGRSHPCHRIAWIIATGEDADGFIDHIDGDRTNNRSTNLRVVSAAENLLNMSRRSDNRRGTLGVVWLRGKDRWFAYIQRDGKRRHLLITPCVGKALKARKAAERELGFHENHGRWGASLCG